MSSEGIEWISFNHWPDCRVWVDRTIDERFGLQYADHGTIHWGINHGPIRKLTAPVAWWTWPGVWWNFGSYDGEPWDHRWVSFRGPQADRWVQTGLLAVPQARPYVRIRRPQPFRQTMDRLFDEIALPARNESLATHLLESLLLQIQEDLESDRRRGPHEQGLVTLADRMRAEPANEYDLEAEAAQLGLSYSHFRALFRDVIGAPPAKYHAQVRIEMAARLLRETTMPIKKICAMVGVDDIYYFNRLFKRHYGLPPGRHRKQARMA